MGKAPAIQHEELSLDTQHPCKILGMVACTFNSSTRKVEKESPELTGYLV